MSMAARDEGLDEKRSVIHLELDGGFSSGSEPGNESPGGNGFGKSRSLNPYLKNFVDFWWWAG